MQVRELVKFLDEFLDISGINDACWNGLQVEGASEVTKVVGAVDAGIEIFEAAVKANADFIITHHGHFWRPVSPAIKGWARQRVKFLLDTGVSLYSAHLPLDRHREVGNNAQILRLLGAAITDEFICDGVNVSWIGTLPTQKPFSEILETIRMQVNHQAQALAFGKETIRTIAVCTGASRSAHFYEAASKADVFITGEPMEVYQTAKDMEMNVVFAGHYATEVFGIKALLTLLEQKFGVDVEFLDVPTGI